MELEPLEPQHSPTLPEDTPVEAAPRKDMWSYWDLAWFTLFAVFSLLMVSVGALSVNAALANFAGIKLPLAEPPYDLYWALAIQTLWSLLVFAFIYYVVAIKHRLPFGEALGFLPARVPLAWFGILGVGLSVAIAGAGQLIGAPHETPLTELLKDPNALWAISIFAVVLGPLFEEIVFRGFLFRPLERGLGGIAAIVITSAVFAAPHGGQYGWAWQMLLLLFTAGAAFGFVRWKSGSLWPAIAMHIGYNGLQIGVLIISRLLGIDIEAPR
jgi:membrane protease YdiL (CAAX protease family)